MHSLNDTELKSDEEILSLVSTDRNFFGVIIRRYENRIIGYVRKMGAQTQEAAEDITQNIFIKTFVHMNSFKKEQKFSNWIYGIARNECIDYWRKNKKHSATVSIEANEQLMSVLASDEDLVEDFAQKCSKEELREALDRLPLKYREILMLRFLEDKTYEDVAQILQKPVSSVGTLVRRAKILLKESIIKQKNELR